MIVYRISYTHPHRHFISLEGRFPSLGREEILLQLAAWRPGRYELGNFAKNIRAWESFDDSGNSLPFMKTTKDRWMVKCKGVDEVVIRYQYYAAELNAGSSYVDDDQLYIN